MAILTEDMKRIVREQRLGFFATVCPDGSPNLSPKGATFVLDDDHLSVQGACGGVRAPGSIRRRARGLPDRHEPLARECAQSLDVLGS